MQDLQEIFNRMTANKEKLRDAKRIVKDAFANSEQYQKTNDEFKVLKEKKKSLENQIRSETPSEIETIADLTADIAADQELLNDVALNQITKGESIQLTDKHKNNYEPLFSVRFRKIG
jgi:hypothetical protein